MNTYVIFKWIDSKWQCLNITLKAKDTYKAEVVAKKKFNLEGILIAMDESMLLLNDCIG